MSQPAPAPRYRRDIDTGEIFRERDPIPTRELISGAVPFWIACVGACVVGSLFGALLASRFPVSRRVRMPLPEVKLIPPKPWQTKLAIGCVVAMLIRILALITWSVWYR